MVSKLIHEFTSCELPNNYLGVFSRTCYVFIAFANVYFRDVVEVAME
jgi:hypothetical protein